LFLAFSVSREEVVKASGNDMIGEGKMVPVIGVMFVRARFGPHVFIVKFRIIFNVRITLGVGIVILGSHPRRNWNMKCGVFCLYLVLWKTGVGGVCGGALSVGLTCMVALWDAALVGTGWCMFDNFGPVTVSAARTGAVVLIMLTAGPAVFVVVLSALIMAMAIVPATPSVFPSCAIWLYGHQAWEALRLRGERQIW
jgi:hypothetical protein